MLFTHRRDHLPFEPVAHSTPAYSSNNKKSLDLSDSSSEISDEGYKTSDNSKVLLDTPKTGNGGGSNKDFATSKGHFSRKSNAPALRARSLSTDEGKWRKLFFTHSLSSNGYSYGFFESVFYCAFARLWSLTAVFSSGTIDFMNDTVPMWMKRDQGLLIAVFLLGCVNALELLSSCELIINYHIHRHAFWLASFSFSTFLKFLVFVSPKKWFHSPVWVRLTSCRIVFP